MSAAHSNCDAEPNPAISQARASENRFSGRKPDATHMRAVSSTARDLDSMMVNENAGGG
jgi:hypothetical protein